MNNTNNEIISLISKKKSILLYFSSKNCPVCMDLEPKIYSLKKRFPHTRFKTVNATINKEIAAQFNVFSFPTVLVFYEGQESIRMVRNFSVQELEGKMNRIYQLLFG